MKNDISEFDWKFYIKKYPNLIKNNINNEKKALNHWIKFGKNEGRICNSKNENENNINLEKLNKYLPNLKTKKPELSDKKICLFNNIYNNFEKIKSTKYKPIHSIEVEYKNIKKVGVVITTHGDNGILTKQAIKSLYKFLPNNTYIILFVNESDEKETKLLKKYFINLNVIYIDDQEKNNGLTGTWNQGIDLCFKNSCEVIILSNNDLFIDDSIYHIIKAASDCPKKKLHYFGPVSNNPGPNNESQYSLSPINCGNKILLKNKNTGNIWNLNGFFLVFPKHSLIKNKLNKYHYFDEKFPFSGNECEWFRRFRKNNGLPILVSRTFVYHYKLQTWKKKIQNDKCMFLININNYEKYIYLQKNFNLDIFYFTDNLDFAYKCISNNIKPMLIFENTNNNRIIQRQIKTSCHKYLPSNYNYSIYIDGNVIPLFTNFEIFDMSHDMICFRHPNKSKKNINDEIKDILKLKLESKENIDKIQKIMKKYKFKDNVGLTETSILIRKHTKDICKMNEFWTKLVNICIRDQASFDFVKTLYKINHKNLNIEDRPILKIQHGT